MKEVTIIAGLAKNRVIGNKGKLPWHISQDLKRFKSLTLEKPVIMGRKTFDSIIEVLGKPLPNRRNIVITRNPDFRYEGIEVANSLEKAIEASNEKEIFIIGGQQIYEQALPLATKLELTIIEKEFEGDAFFPEINNEWVETARESHKSESFGFSFITYKKGSKNVNVQKLIKSEEERQKHTLNMIASENFASPEVRRACASVLMNKYSEGYPKKRYYQGNENIDEIELYAINKAKELFQAEHANVQPYSGSTANFAVFLALLEPGDKFMGLDLSSGGHLTHGSSVNFSGKIYQAIPYGVDEKTGFLDMEKIREIAIKEKPKLLISGLTAYPREIDFKRFQEIAEEVGAVHLADVSHIAGLIASGALENPVPYTDVVMFTTHKTLRGPRGAIILCKEKFAKQIDKAVFPGSQGGPHDNIIAAKAIALEEALTPEFKVYGEQVIKNAQALAESLREENIKLFTKGTDNHLILIDLREFGTGLGRTSAIALESAGIVCNANSIPYDTSSPFKPSGLRLGTAILTTRGMKEPEMKQIGKWIASIIKNSDNLELQQNINSEVKALCEKFPLNI